MLRAIVVLCCVAQTAAAQIVRLPLESLPVVARIPVPARPDWLAMGFGSVWVVDYRPPSLVRIDPATNQVTASIPLGGHACLGIAVTLTALWVADCEHHTVAEIDPAKNAVVRTLSVDFSVDDEGALAAVEGSLWLFVTDSTAATSTLVRANAQTGAIEKRIVVGAGSYVVAGDSTALWVASTRGAAVMRVDPRKNAVVASVPVTPRPKFLTVDARGVWVLHQRTGSVSLIDPTSNEFAASVPADVPTPWGDIAAGAGAVWVSVDGTPVTRIDPTTHDVTHQFAGGSGADAIRFGFGSLWVSDHEHGEVWRIDPDRISAPPPAPR